MRGDCSHLTCHRQDGPAQCSSSKIGGGCWGDLFLRSSFLNSLIHLVLLFPISKLLLRNCSSKRRRCLRGTFPSPPQSHLPFGLCPRILAPCPNESSYPCCFQGKKTSIDILVLTPHPLLSQNREALPYVLSFSLKLSVNTQAGRLHAVLLLPVIVLAPSWEKGYSNEPATDSLPIQSFINMALPVNSLLARSWNLFHVFLNFNFFLHNCFFYLRADYDLFPSAYFIIQFEHNGTF